jgi:hypothetical protein
MVSYSLRPHRKPTELGCLSEMEPELLLARDRPPELARPVADETIHRDAHRIDQHRVTLADEPDIGLSF